MNSHIKTNVIVEESLSYSDNMKFSTPDKGNDGSSENCASKYRSGCWFGNRGYANPNGQYTPTLRKLVMTT